VLESTRCLGKCAFDGFKTPLEIGHWFQFESHSHLASAGWLGVTLPFQRLILKTDNMTHQKDDFLIALSLWEGNYIVDSP
jgi:hypothetical protein